MHVSEPLRVSSGSYVSCVIWATSQSRQHKRSCLPHFSENYVSSTISLFDLLLHERSVLGSTLTLLFKFGMSWWVLAQWFLHNIPFLSSGNPLLHFQFVWITIWSPRSNYLKPFRSTYLDLSKELHEDILFRNENIPYSLYISTFKVCATTPKLTLSTPRQEVWAASFLPVLLTSNGLSMRMPFLKSV